MSEINQEFPESTDLFLKAVDFQDNEQEVVFQGWKKKSNEDDSSTRKNPRTWKEKLDFTLSYSYPEKAKDKAGDPVLDNETGQPITNKYWDAEHPHGYSVVYIFDNGELESGSKPLFETFCRLRPKKGETISILRTGTGLETAWTIKRVKPGIPDIQVDAPQTNDPLDSVDLKQTDVPF